MSEVIPVLEVGWGWLSLSLSDEVNHSFVRSIDSPAGDVSRSNRNVASSLLEVICCQLGNSRSLISWKICYAISACFVGSLLSFFSCIVIFGSCICMMFVAGLIKMLEVELTSMIWISRGCDISSKVMGACGCSGNYL